MLLCWFVGGIIAFLGVRCYGELGAMFPRAGDDLFYKRLGRVTKKHGVPAHSILLQAAIAIFMVITSSFDREVNPSLPIMIGHSPKDKLM